ncbi:MAG: hypothetical protein IKZ84_08630 [Victivallales bacterium]|nr:hypothetical protein [Victivallales bacterium]
MAKVPLSLIIDDGSPVNLYYFHDLMREHELIVPIEQVLRFASICKKNGVRGKFSVVPMPCNLGRLDKGLSHCPWEHVQQFIKTVRENVAPMFSLTPEIISHYWAFDVKTERVLDVREDIYFSTLTAEQIADYVSYAIKILCNVDLIPEGVTSPWMTGIDNEQNYAEGIGMAFKRTLNKDQTFYFLHNQATIKAPKVMCNSSETGKVVSIPRDFPDVFWPGNDPGNDEEAKRKIKNGIDGIISEDGRSGQFVNLLDAERPLVFIAHWQSLFSDGRFYGLDGFEALMERVTRYFGDKVEWLTFKEIAERY